MNSYDNFFLPVDDMDGAKDFYGNILGLDTKFDFSDMGMTAFSIGSEEPAVILKDKNKFPDVRPTIWFTVDDVYPVYHKLKAKGVHFLSEPFHIRTGNAVEFEDPFGNRLGITDYNIIRTMRTEEIPACVDIIRRSFATVADEYGFTEENAPRFTAFATTAERLTYQSEAEHRPMYVYERQGKLCGYYSLLMQDNGECELNNLAVLPEYRHMGIGKALLDHAFASARESGCRVVNIGIVEENAPLRRWYEENGAVHTGTKKFDFFPFTCGYMIKEL